MGAPSLSDAFRQLGFPNSSVPTAIAAYKSVSSAQAWIEVLGDSAFDDAYINVIRTPEVSPDAVRELHASGCVGVRAVRLARDLSRAGIPVHQHLAWSEAGFEKHLSKFMPRFVDGFGSDDVLEILRRWSSPSEGNVDAAGELRRVLDLGHTPAALRAHLGTGLSGHQFHGWAVSGVPEEQWTDWSNADISPVEATHFVNAGCVPAAARLWLEEGMSGADAARYHSMGLTIEVAREWTGAGLTPTDATMFIGSGVKLADAREWTGSGFDAAAALDFIDFGVTPGQAARYREDGIEIEQLTHTDSGIEVTLEPWQEDPLEQVPRVIEAGHFGFTIWSDVLGGDMTAYDIRFHWDGRHVAEWYEDISLANDLSFASSSPSQGVIAWPNAEDVELTFNWHGLGLQGHHRISGRAPKGESGARNPKYWLELAETLLTFVLIDLGSGARRDRVRYLDDDESELELDDLFRTFLDNADAGGTGFESWLQGQVTAGVYLRVGGG